MHIIIPVVVLAMASAVAGSLRFVALGDWGDEDGSGRRRQSFVADIMDQWCGLHRCDFILTTGDNFYPEGVHSDSDPRFTINWRDIYDGDNIRDLPWYVSLGDHDHVLDREVHQVQFGLVEERWQLPYFYYSFQMEDDETSALFYAIDSESLKRGKHHPATQLRHLEETLANSDAHWKIVFGHHTPVSVGKRPGDPTIQQKVVPICEAHGVNLFLGGHDHNLQHITKAEKLDVVISGGGGKSLYEYKMENEDQARDLGYRPIFFGESYGFVGVTLSEAEMKVEYFTYSRLRRGRVKLRKLYEFTRRK